MTLMRDRIFKRRAGRCATDLELHEFLTKLPKIGETILTNADGNRYSPRGLTALFTNRLRKLGHGPGSEMHYTLHGLRKTLAVELAGAGATVQQLMYVLGHKNPKMALYYTREANKAKMIEDAFALRSKAIKAEKRRGRREAA